jgi:hypothetical protein
MEITEPKEAWIRLHTQEVRGSSPCAPTILFNNFRIRAEQKVVHLCSESFEVFVLVSADIS